MSVTTKRRALALSLALFAIVLVCAGAGTATAQDGTQTYEYDGDENPETWTVPDGVDEVYIEVDGAGGGGGAGWWSGDGADGGDGGRVVGTVDVSDRDELLIYVAQAGQRNAGGSGRQPGESGAAGGGGMSAVVDADTDSDLLAGGGGGGGGNSMTQDGGAGGGSSYGIGGDGGAGAWYNPEDGEPGTGWADEGDETISDVTRTRGGGSDNTQDGQVRLFWETPTTFDVTIDDTNTAVAEGETLSVDATVTNSGQEEATQTVTLDVGGAERDSAEITLDPEQQETVTLTWETGAGDAGSHTATVASETDDDTAAVTVQEPAQFDVRSIETTDVTAGGNATVTAGVENVGDVTGTQNVTLDVNGVGPSVDSESLTLASGENATVDLVWETGVDDVDDDHELTVSTADDSAAGSVSVLRPDSISVLIDDVHEPVAGETLRVTASIENTGDSREADTINLSIDGSLKDSTTVNLDPDEQTTKTLRWDTNLGHVGAHDLNLTSGSDFAETTATVHELGQVPNCRVLDAPGIYSLVDDLVGSATGCLEITSDDVHFDGGGHDVLGQASSSGTAISVDGPGTLDNVTIENVAIEGRTTGVRADGTDGLEIRNVTVRSTDADGIVVADATSATLDSVAANESDGAGVVVESSAGTTLRNVTADGNADAGVLIGANAEGTLLTNVTAASNDRGVAVAGATGTTVRSSTARENAGHGFAITNASDTLLSEVVANDNGASGVSVTDTDGPAPGTTVANATLYANEHGVRVAGVEGTTLRDNLLVGNDRNGLTLLDGASNATSTDDVIAGNDAYGVHAEDATGTDVMNATTVANTDGTVAVGPDPLAATGLNVGNSTASNTTLDFTASNVTVEPQPNPPETPDSVTAIGRYVTASDRGDDAYFDVDFRYDADDVDGLDEESLAIWDHDGDSWTERNSTVETDERTVSRNVTDFSDFGVFGQSASSGGPGGPTPPPEPAPTPVDVIIEDVPDAVTEGDPLDVRATITNAGDDSVTRDIELRIDGTTVDETTVTLDPGATTTETFSSVPDSSDVGERTVTVWSADDEDSATVTVEPDDRGGAGGGGGGSPPDDDDDTVNGSSDGNISSSLPELPQWTGEVVDYDPSPQTQHVGGYAWLTILLTGLGCWVLLTRYTREATVFAAALFVSAARTATDVIHVLADGVFHAGIPILPVNLLLEVYVGVLFCSFAVLAVDERWLPKRRSIATLAGVAVAATLLVATNPLHSLVFGELSFVAEPFGHVDAELAAVGWLLVALNVGLLVSGAAVLGQSLLTQTNPAWRPVAILSAGTCLAVIATGITVVDRGPLPSFDYYAVGIAGFMSFATIGLLGHGLRRIRETARRSIVDELEDAVVILDDAWTVVECNAAARKLVAGLEPGTAFDDAFAYHPTVSTPGETTIDEVDFGSLVRSTPDDDPPLDGGTAPNGHATDGGIDPGFQTADGGAITDDRTANGGTAPNHAADGEFVAERTDPHFQIRTTAIGSDNGDLVGYAVRLADITELTHRATELERQNDRLDQFASTVSHDLRNPLTVASGYLDLLRGEVLPNDETEVNRETNVDVTRVSSHISTVLDALDRMETIIDDILALTRADEPVTDTSTVSLETVVDAAWESVDTREATCERRTDGPIRADPDRLQRIFENLFRNSVEHAGPDVTITVEDIDDGFAVADDGPGIPDEETETVFEQGYSGTDGTGLGLAIVDQLAIAHGWSVELDPDHDGARFRFAGCDIRRAPAE